MADLNIPWAPRCILTGRVFRLPIQSDSENVELEAEGFVQCDHRFAKRDAAHYYYLRAPDESGDYTVRACGGGQSAAVEIEVRSLSELRRPRQYNGAQWPRRWPLGKEWHSTKSRQTLQEELVSPVNEDLIAQWAGLDDAELWRRMPPSELPGAHFLNVHQGCPNCGTAIFGHGGHYPWKQNFAACDFRSECPSCGAVFPSNDLAAGNFTSGEYADDGFGYWDEEGHLFLFVAVYAEKQALDYLGGIQALTYRLQTGGFDEGIARRLGLMLLRYAAEEAYLAAVPQFRYGPSKRKEEPFGWGQTDWASQPDPIAALQRRGGVCYDISSSDTVGSILGPAYDTVWPLLRQDGEVAQRARGLGLEVQGPGEVVVLVEESLAILLQCGLDGAAVGNKPMLSQGMLTMLRALDRPDAQDLLRWHYDEGGDKLRGLTVNDFCPDGTPPESSGGYNTIHVKGFFALEHQLRQLRQLHPEAYPESLFPSLVQEKRVPRVLRVPYEIGMVGKTRFQFGDGGSKDGPERLGEDEYYEPLDMETLERAVAFTGDPVVEEIRDAARQRRHRHLGSTVHDGGVTAILRTGEAPERAAVRITYGDANLHRHRDLLDVQLFAFGRAFLTDLGGQSWSTVDTWEGHWAMHNTVWGSVPGRPNHSRISGRGRLLHTLFVDGLQVLDVEAERWGWNEREKRWYRLGVHFRRLIALVETDGQGVAVIDLARIRGGEEHWRVCRGLEGSLALADVAEERRPGTVADAAGERGQLDVYPDYTTLANVDDLRELALPGVESGLGQAEVLDHPDYAALAYMDEVATLEQKACWKGSWQCSREPEVHLDLYQLGASDASEVLTARATAPMGPPEESSYSYRTVLWRNKPAHEKETTCVDLVFEPRVGEATLDRVEPVAVEAGGDTARGLELATGAGKSVKLYWAPDAGAEEETLFADGTALRGGLAAVAGGKAVGVSITGLRMGEGEHRFVGVQEGKIVALDRGACSIDVGGLDGVGPGDRIRVNPAGCGHNYGIEAVEDLGGGILRLALDMGSLLGRARAACGNGEEVELDFPIVARTGRLHGARLQIEASGAWAEIVTAVNDKYNMRHGFFQPDASTTIVRIKGQIDGLKSGVWVSVVDYVVGDTVMFEPVFATA